MCRSWSIFWDFLKEECCLGFWVMEGAVFGLCEFWLFGCCVFYLNVCFIWICVRVRVYGVLVCRRRELWSISGVLGGVL